MELPQRVREALIQKTLEGEVILHNSRDSTAIEAREKPAKKPNVEKISKKKGHRKKGEEKLKAEPSPIEKQRTISLEKMIEDLPIICDKGTKKDSHGNLIY